MVDNSSLCTFSGREVQASLMTDMNIGKIDKSERLESYRLSRKRVVVEHSHTL